jgi:hypothetical protein
MKEPGCKAADKSHECTCQEHQEGPSPSSGSDALIFDRKKLLEITSRLIEETMIGYQGTGSGSGRGIKNGCNISGHSPGLSLCILHSWRKRTLHHLRGTPGSATRSVIGYRQTWIGS